MGTLTCLRGFARVAPYSDLAIHSLTLRIGCSDPTKRLVGDCYYALARLCGHQNRKHDHPPVWQVNWEGWKELLPMATGYDVAKTRYYKKCG